MLDWFKQFGTAIAGAALAFLAFMAVSKAQRHRKQAQAWENEAQDAVDNKLDHAEAALTQAKKHQAEADRIKLKAEARINEAANRDDDMADILDRWRRS